jgi:hypothetical protein
MKSSDFSDSSVEIWMPKYMHDALGYSLGDPVSVKTSKANGRVKLQIGFGVGRGGSRNSELTPKAARRIAVQLIRAAERVTPKSARKSN